MDRNIVSVNMSHVDNIHELRTLFMSCRLLQFANSGYSSHCIQSKRLYVFEEIDDTHSDLLDNPFIDRSLKQTLQIEKKCTFDTMISSVVKSVTAEDEDKKPETKPVKSPITVGDMLDVLDGLAEAEDRVIIFTTNHPEKIDPALKRPGRIDLILEFKKLRVLDINSLYKCWFGVEIAEEKLKLMKDYIYTQAELGKLFLDMYQQPQAIIDKLVESSI